MPQVVVAVAVQAALTAKWITATQAFWLALGANLAIGASQQSSLPDYSRQLQRVLRSATTARRIVYGRAMTSGPLAFGRSAKQGEPVPGFGWAFTKEHEYLHLVIVLAGHEIDAVEEVWFGDQRATDWDAYGTKHAVSIGTDDGTTLMLPLLPDDLISVTIDGTTYDNVGSSVQSKLEAAGFSVRGDYWTTIEGPTVGIRFDVTDVQSATGPAKWVTETTGDTVYSWTAHLGTADQEADADLVARYPEWTTAHRGRGVAYLVVKLRWHAEAWVNGVPNIRAVVRGKKVYDPRTGLTAWSDNAALCTLDYIRYKWGLAVPDGEWNVDSWIAAANVSDEDEVTPSGTMQKRYTVNGVITLDQEPVKPLGQLCAAMAGTAYEFMGTWFGYAGADIPATVSLDENDLRGNIRFRPRASRTQLFNCVRGTYVDPSKNWVATEFPPVTSAFYQGEDGGDEISREIELPFTNDSVRAQRIAKISLDSARQAIVIEWPGKLSCLRVRPWLPVRITVKQAGWFEKLFVVRNWKMADDFGVDLVLQEYAPESWDWNEGDATMADPAPNTNLPDPYNIAAPQDVTLSSGAADLLVAGDGTIMSRIRVQWSAPSNSFVTVGGRTEIQYRRTGSEGSWKAAAPALGGDTEAFIAPVCDLAYYDVRLRHVNCLAVASEWTIISAYTVIGKSAPPTDPRGFTAVMKDRQVYLSWVKPPDLDVRETEIRKGGTDWFSAEFVAMAPGTDYRCEAQAGTTTWRIKHIDTSGNDSINNAASVLTVNAPAITSLTAEVIDNNVLLRWVTTAGTLPIDGLELRKGGSWAAGTVVGVSRANFAPLFESVGGTITYWAAPYDIAGNYGTPRSVTAQVSAPPDYVLNVNWTDDLSGAAVNMLVESGELVGSVNTTETIASHFDSHGWASAQDQINAGYPIYIEPGMSTASYERIFDYGTTLASSMITLALTSSVLSGAPTFTPTLSVSTSLAGPWTDYAGAWQAYASGFRYVKVHIDVSGVAIYRLKPLTLRLDSKKKRDFGTGTYVPGKAVSFNGTTGYGKVAASSTTNPGGPFTLVMDFTAVTTSSVKTVVEWNSGSTNGVTIRQNNSNDLYINCKDTLGGTHQKTLAGVLVSGRTYRLVVRVTATVMTVYLDGRPVGSLTASFGTPDTTGDLYFGYRPSGTPVYWSGTVDSFRLFSRACTDAELAEFSGDVFADLTAEKVRIGFDEGAGSTAADASGNGNNCALSGGFTWADDAGGIVRLNEAFVDVNAISLTLSAGGAAYILYDFNDVPNPRIFRALPYTAAGVRAAGSFSFEIGGY